MAIRLKKEKYIKENGMMKKKKKKSIHELAKEYPDTTYRNLEKYREADRWEEAIGIGHNHPPSPIEENEDKA